MSQLEDVVSLLEDETTFGFNEIYLNNELEGPLLNTVKLFSFGTYRDYLKRKEEFIQLSEKALYKLKQLTLLTEALKSNSITYDLLLNSLVLESDTELERLIAESIYSKIIEAKIFSKQRLLKVSTCRGRDVSLEVSDNLSAYDSVTTVSDLLQGLEYFSERIDKALAYTEEIGRHLKVEEADSIPDEESSVPSTQRDSVNSTEGFLPDGRRHSTVGFQSVPSQATIALPEVSEINIASYNGRKRKTQD